MNEIAGLPESFKDMRQELRLNTLARVADPDVRPSGRTVQTDFDRAALGRKFDGIGKQVPHHLLYAIAIAPDEWLRPFD